MKTATQSAWISEITAAQFVVSHNLSRIYYASAPVTGQIREELEMSTEEHSPVPELSPVLHKSNADKPDTMLMLSGS